MPIRERWRSRGVAESYPSLGFGLARPCSMTTGWPFYRSKGDGIRNARIDINPRPMDGVSTASVRFFRNTTNTGANVVVFHPGDGSTDEDARIGVKGANSWFQLGGGSVGIGTNSPGYKLDVAGSLRSTGLWTETATPQMKLIETDFSKTWIVGGAAGEFFIGEDDTGGANRRIQIEPGGEVGIGTYDPMAKLDVNGTTRTKVLTITGGSDLAEPFNMVGTPRIL